MVITIDNISPVAFSVFGLPVRWYALAYIAGFVIGYFLLRSFLRKSENGLDLTKKQIDDLFTYIILGVILGGRLGYVLFYNIGEFIAEPLKIFAVWKGGMSFHGGLIGVIVATMLFAKRWERGLKILDLLAVVAPVGLFFGRIANFINVELLGRATNSNYGVVFSSLPPNSPVCVPENPCHPSQLYEAATEGILLFIIMYCLYRFTKLAKFPGALGGMMLMLYAVFRIVCEQFRMPDIQLEFMVKNYGISMGQLLSLIMFVAGVCVFCLAFRKRR
ncbi:MAG: prolipoprotein diacylglyceryl transferase [Alphaproteobacteria bacterium]|nr:prolipoprotein diacylglyceryl transferase [Alphaproteobacteria bacterium]